MKHSSKVAIQLTTNNPKKVQMINRFWDNNTGRLCDDSIIYYK